MGQSIEFDYDRDMYKWLPFDVEYVTNVVKVVVLGLVALKLLTNI